MFRETEQSFYLVKYAASKTQQQKEEVMKKEKYDGRKRSGKKSFGKSKDVNGRKLTIERRGPWSAPQ